MKHFSVVCILLLFCAGLAQAQVEWAEHMLSANHNGPSGSSVWWFENFAGSWAPHSIMVNRGTMRDADVADFDVDGDMDVIVGAEGENAVYVFLNDAGSWTETTLRASYDTPWRITVADVDEDGDVDALGAAAGWDFGGSEFTHWEVLGTPVPPPVDIELHP